MSNGTEFFAEAVKELIKLTRAAHGEKTKIAQSMGISLQYLADLLAGRRNWSDKLRDKVSDALGFSVAELYAIGEALRRDHLIFPYILRVLETPHSLKRAVLIFRFVAREFSMHPIGLVTEKTLEAWDSAELKQYLAKSYTDAMLYHHFRKLIQLLLKNYLSPAE